MLIFLNKTYNLITKDLDFVKNGKSQRKFYLESLLADIKKKCWPLDLIRAKVQRFYRK